MDDLQREAMHLLIQLQKLKPKLFDYYMYEPMDEVTITRMRNDLIQITSTSNSLSHTTIKYYYGNGDTIENFIIDESYYPDVDELTKDNVVEKMMKYVEEAIEKYIYDTFDRYYIQEYGSYVYSMLTEKAYEITEDIITNQDEYVIICDKDKLIDVLFEAIDLNYFYGIIDDIPNQPITMEEKMADVGMSYKDFL